METLKIILTCFAIVFLIIIVSIPVLMLAAKYLQWWSNLLGL